MCVFDDYSLDSDRITRLDIVRAWRDMARFEGLTVAEQWADIAVSWPPPFAEGIETHPEMRLIHTELVKATTAIQTMLAAWEALKAEVDRHGAEGSDTEASVWRIALAEGMLEISELTHNVAECQQRITQINARSEEIRQVVEAETRERYRLAHENLSQKIAMALEGSQDHPVSAAEDFEADVVLLRFKLVALKMEATGPDISGPIVVGDALFKSILADYVSGDRETRTKILYLLKTHMTTDPEVMRRLEEALGLYRAWEPPAAK